jgi:hypothetical protein
MKRLLIAVEGIDAQEKAQLPAIYTISSLTVDIAVPFSENRPIVFMGKLLCRSQFRS